MRKHIALAALGCLLATSSSALAQNTTTATGTGTAVSGSQSGSVAIAGGGRSNSSLTIVNPANTTSTLNQNVTGSTTSRTEVTGTSTVKNVPTAIAPGLAAAGLETCLGSISGGGSAVGFGASFGTTIPDPGCAARLDARTLWSMGLKGAAVARLCLTPDIYRSMPDVCARYMPQPAPTGILLSASVGGGSIAVVDGRTGLTRQCDNYNAERQKCLQWAGEAPRRIAPRRQRVAAVVHHEPKAVAAINSAIKVKETAKPAPAKVEETKTAEPAKKD